MIEILNRIAAILLRPLARVTFPLDWHVLRSEIGYLVNKSKSDPRFAHAKAVVDVLVAAEDRRFYSHHGFDIGAICRAVAVYVFRKKLQGASTITQQLVRTVTKHYTRSLRRKYKEVLLASLVDSHFTKEEQLCAYLFVAYFGWRMNGLFQTCLRLSISFPITKEAACGIVARLKYPEPQHPSAKLKQEIENRTAYLLRSCKVEQKI